MFKVFDADSGTWNFYRLEPTPAPQFNLYNSLRLFYDTGGGNAYVVSVGATTEHGCLASYSNDGSRLTLVAPGGGSDAPNADNPLDQQNCHPGIDEPPIFQQLMLKPAVFDHPFSLCLILTAAFVVKALCQAR